MKKSNYEINGQGTDSSPWTSHPASDRINDYNDTLSDRTDDMYSHNSCLCEISDTDREKRIEELDELIHDKIGDTDKHMKNKNKEQYNIYNTGKEADRNISSTTDRGIKSESVKNESSKTGRAVDNSRERYSSINDTTSDDVEGCGCGGGFMDDDTTPNRIDDSGDDWVVERIDIWVDDTADDQTGTGSVYDNQIGDNNKDDSYRNKTNNVKSDTDSGMSC